MFDVKWICENPESFNLGLARRNLSPKAELIIQLDEERRAAQKVAQEIQTERNSLSKKIGVAIANKENPQEIISKVSKTKEVQQRAEARLSKKEKALQDIVSSIPNLPMKDVPDGLTEESNVEVRRVGEIPSFDFSPKKHFELGEKLGLMDFENAGKMSGSRFVLLYGQLALLERALSNFMIDLHTQEHDLVEVNPPALVNDNAMFGTGQLPKFGGDLFRTEDGYWLIPTAEVPLTNIVANSLLEEERLPCRYTAMTWCFRSEAGAAGKDTRGMIRQHQFTKVEMVSITKPEDSVHELNRMTECAEEVLRRLGLPFRTVILSTGDMGFGAQKTFDIEVWLPGEGKFREISSCSNCGDFQARRMNARFREKKNKEIKYVHTLNGSGLAVGRAMIAVIENYQQADGSIVIPKVLRSYMQGSEVIEPKE